jgi:hypothetical protein
MVATAGTIEIAPAGTLPLITSDGFRAPSDGGRNIHDHAIHHGDHALPGPLRSRRAQWRRS